jgi:hypothetical protein
MPTFDGSTLPEVLAAQILFWVLLPVVLLAPPRWAILAWLVMGNLDATGPGQSVSEAGVLNAVKSLGVPLWLIWRLRQTPGSVHTTPTARLWMILTLYAATCTLWSPFQLGNMVGIFLAFVVLERAARRGLLNSTVLLSLMTTSLLLAVVQTYYFGGASYGFDGPDQPSRLSSFISAQQFAAFLVAFLALVLWHPKFGPMTRLISSLVWH